ncbi:leucine-rich repeat domain-containing protein [Ralstonia solanacearum]|uniref:leucine-rich repeat domain-containing protein n=1 Tax=Ralstonia solanacearum TaxID=305 RepID=UPI0009E9C938|nr:leucine-rich repeat domain-containing protein [Ralstonia solanacearum]AXV87267.1 leucine-rich repeat domain-containing protein [Ralstonia solanacearum]AXW06751.1 leucine-rich repeat domain-containing protein [Ralstonia solanacearum]AXW24493.1 leucine-rich repeat domain-containing protein [Ralstonia solanacearum]AXW81430.1 leucine-rich repeat domain-containing protein [Ralstonia solanacearum]
MPVSSIAAIDLGRLGSERVAMRAMARASPCVNKETQSGKHMLKKIASGLSIPINLSGSTANNTSTTSTTSKSRRQRGHDLETLKWIKERRTNERRDVAADRIADTEPGGKVKLDQLGLTELPAHVLEPAVDATHVRLSGNSLQEIPPGLTTFNRLRHLDVSRNEFRSLSPVLGGLSNLRSLDVSHNGLAEIPGEIGNLKKLESLNAGDNALEYLPAAIGNLGELKNLSLSGNLLTSVPEEIRHCTKLEEIDLSRNHFSALSSAIGSLAKLRKLSVRDNRLIDQIGETGLASRKAIPESVSHLANLREFDVSGNPLTFLPNGFGPFEYVSKRDMKIRKQATGSLLSKGLEIRIENTPLSVELAEDGRLLRLANVADPQYNELYQPPRFREDLYEDYDRVPPPDMFEQSPIAMMTRTMPEVLAAQRELGNDGLGPLNELMRALAGNRMPAGDGRVETQHVPMQTAEAGEHSGARPPVQPGNGNTMSSGPFVARHVERQSPETETAPGPSWLPGGVPPFGPGLNPHASSSGVPAGYPQATQRAAGTSFAQPSFAQPPFAQPPFAQPPFAQPQPPFASLFGGMLQPPMGATVHSPLLEALFQKLAVVPNGPQPPYVHAAPLAAAGPRKTLFDYSVPSYGDEAQYDIDMLGIQQIQQTTLAGLADLHRERIYLQGAQLQQRVQEAKLLGNPKRDLWTLGVMMFRQHVICNLADSVARCNTEKKAMESGTIGRVEDPLQIALVYQTLVCKPTELQILGLDKLRKQLDENPAFRSMFGHVVAPDRHDQVREQIMKEVGAAERKDNGRQILEYVNQQPFWQEFLSEQKNATRASWIAANGF